MNEDNEATSGEPEAEPVDLTENLNALPVQEAVEPEAETEEAAESESEQSSDDETGSEEEEVHEDDDADSEDTAKTKRRKPTRVERELRRTQQKLEELQQAMQPVQSETAQAQPALPPQPSDFPGDEQGYYRAAEQHRIDQGVAQALARRDEEKRVQDSQREHEERVSTFKKTAEKLAEKYPDFDEVMDNDEVQISRTVAQAVVRTGEVGPEIGYYLNKNPEIAAKLSSMDPFSLAIEIGSLKAKFSAPPPKKVTKAKKPVKPLAGSGAPVGKKPLSEMSMEEYAKARMPQLQSARRG